MAASASSSSSMMRPSSSSSKALDSSSASSAGLFWTRRGDCTSAAALQDRCGACTGPTGTRRSAATRSAAWRYKCCGSAVDGLRLRTSSSSASFSTLALRGAVGRALRGSPRADVLPPTEPRRACVRTLAASAMSAAETPSSFPGPRGLEALWRRAQAPRRSGIAEADMRRAMRAGVGTGAPICCCQCESVSVRSR